MTAQSINPQNPTQVLEGRVIDTMTGLENSLIAAVRQNVGVARDAILDAIRSYTAQVNAATAHIAQGRQTVGLAAQGVQQCGYNAQLAQEVLNFRQRLDAMQAQLNAMQPQAQQAVATNNIAAINQLAGQAQAIAAQPIPVPVQQAAAIGTQVPMPPQQFGATNPYFNTPSAQPWGVQYPGAQVVPAPPAHLPIAMPPINPYQGYGQQPFPVPRVGRGGAGFSRILMSAFAGAIILMILGILIGVMVPPHDAMLAFAEWGALLGFVGGGLIGALSNN